MMKGFRFGTTRVQASALRYLFLIALLPAGGMFSVPAWTDGMMSGLSAGWSFKKERRSCVLEQRSNFGVARFSGEPGLDMRFELVLVQDPSGDGLVHLSAEAPEWHPAWPDVDERGPVNHVRGGTKTMVGAAADRLLRDLYKGRLLRLSGRGPFVDDDADVHAFVVMPTRLAESHTAFANGRRWEMPGNFADMELTRIGFGTGQTTLSAADRSRLDVLVRYILADRRLMGIRIDGLSDARGSDRTNRTLSQRRAAAVADHLVRRGIPRALLSVHAHGAQYLQAQGLDEIAQARNRRVTVQLERVGDDTPGRVETMSTELAAAPSQGSGPP